MLSPMMNPPNVSVIVPVYNAEKTIAECINSLLGLNYPKENLELICVDNASTDGTPDTLNQYKKEMKILFEKKRGPAAARNKGLFHADNEIVALTDADCIVDKDWLLRIVSPLHDENIGIVGGKILSKRPCNTIEEFGENIHDHDKSINEFKPPYVITMNCALKLSVLRKVGFFNEDFLRGEDVDLSYRIFKSGYTFFYAAGALVYHHNEHNLYGLFKEGYNHGFHSIQVLRDHQEFLKNFGHRRFKIQSYLEIIFYLKNFIFNINRNHSLCHFVFNAGKKTGKFLGSLRFRYIEL